MQRLPTWSARATARPRGVLLAVGMVAAALAPRARAAAQPIFPSASLCDAVALNLVQNCGFEAGDPTGWTVAASSQTLLAIPDLATSAHTGSYYLRFSSLFPNSPPSDVLERLVTTPGAQYTFSFWLVSNAAGGEPASTGTFRAFWDGRQVFDLVGQGPNFDTGGYQQYRVTETATTALTEVRFEGYNVAASYYLDDVSVTPAAVPEPATVALVGGGAAALGVLARRRRRG